MVVIKIKKPKEPKCLIKRILKFNDFKICLFKNEIILKSQQTFKIEAHSVYAEEINKIVQSYNDDKRLQIFDRITSYTYGTNAGKLCKTKLLKHVKIKWLILIIILMKKKEHNPKLSYISYHLYIILVIGSSGSGKTNALLNLINN